MTELQVLNVEHWRQVFDKYDKNKDGRISYHELKDIFRSEEYDKDIPKHVVKVILRDADTNRDGELSFMEFKNMVEHPDNGYFFSNLQRKYVTKYVNLFIPQQDTVDGQYEDSYSLWPPPLMMILMSLIQLVLYLIDLAKGFDGHGEQGPIAQVLIYKPKRRLEIWRYLTYMFVHIGRTHLSVNIFVQLVLGIPLEMVHRGFRVAGVYLLGVVAGSLGTSVTDPTVLLAGASGGVYALMTAHIASTIMNWKEMSFPLIHILIFLFITICDVGTAIYNRYTDNVNNIGYAAHFYGATAGLLIGIFMLRNLKVTRLEKKLRLIAIVLSVLLMGTAICINIFYKSHFPDQEI